jgi:hypothetical protein
MNDRDIEWNRIKDTPHNPNAQIVILNPDAHINAPAGPGVKGERRRAFLLYHAYPIVGEYIEAVRALTEAGLIKRYAGRGAEVANSDINWDIWNGHIRLEGDHLQTAA